MRPLYGANIQGGTLLDQGQGQSFWEAVDPSTFGITALRFPAGTNSYLVYYKSGDNLTRINSKEANKQLQYQYIGSLELAATALTESLSYDLDRRIIGVTPNFDLEMSFRVPNAASTIQLANEPTIHIAQTPDDLDNYLCFSSVTGSDPVVNTRDGVTQTFYSYAEWIRQVSSFSNPWTVQAGSSANGISYVNKLPPQSSFEFHTTQPWTARYADQIYLYESFDSEGNQLTPTAGQIATHKAQVDTWVQLADLWSSGSLRCGGIASTQKYKPDLINRLLVQSFDSVPEGYRLTDPYTFWSESLAYMKTTYPGATVNFTEWKTPWDEPQILDPETGELLEGFNNVNDYNASASLDTAATLLSFARLRSEDPSHLIAASYQSLASKARGTLAMIEKVQGAYTTTPLGTVFTTYKDSFWGSYIQTSELVDRPSGVMAEAFIPYDDQTKIQICYANASSLDIDINLVVNGASPIAIVAAAGSYGVHESTIPVAGYVNTYAWQGTGGAATYINASDYFAGVGPGDTWAFSAWVRVASGSNERFELFTVDTTNVGGQAGGKFQLECQNSHVNFYHYEKDSSGTTIEQQIRLTTSNYSIRDGDWHHLYIVADAYTDDFNDVTLYVDGVDASTVGAFIRRNQLAGTGTVWSQNGSNAGRFGTRSTLSANVYMDELAFWTGSVPTVSDIYNNGASHDLSAMTEEPLIWFNFNNLTHSSGSMTGSSTGSAQPLATSYVYSTETI